jgi:hypothetical protein
MPSGNNMESTVKNLISSYELRLESIGSIFDATHELLQSFRDSFLDTKLEREKVVSELRDNLAKNESLRRNDFNNMMKDVISAQDKREKEVWNMLNNYIGEQKEMSHMLSINFNKFKDSIIVGETQRIKEFKNIIKDILDRQSKRKEDVVFKLKEFQQEREDMSRELKKLLEEREKIRIKDVKAMLKEFKNQKEERVACKEERREEVSKMLGDFKKERLEAGKYWKTAQNKIAKIRTESPKVKGL